MSPGAIILPSRGIRQTRYFNGNTADIIRTILFADSRVKSFVHPSQVKTLIGPTEKDTLRNVFLFVRNNLTYQADRPGLEIVRSPGYLMQTGIGDCKSFSLLIAALLQSLGFKYRYRFTGPTASGPFRHVYIVATTSKGEDVVLDATPPGRFNYNPPHRRRRDISPGSVRLSGINGSTLESGLVLAGFFLLLFLFSKKIK